MMQPVVVRVIPSRSNNAIRRDICNSLAVRWLDLVRLEGNNAPPAIAALLSPRPARTDDARRTGIVLLPRQSGNFPCQVRRNGGHGAIKLTGRAPQSKPLDTGTSSRDMQDASGVSGAPRRVVKRVAATTGKGFPAL
jgi:hypothetical protein